RFSRDWSSDVCSSDLRARLVAEDAVGGGDGVVLELLGFEEDGQGGDGRRLGLVDLGADRAAALSEVLGRLGQDPLAPPSPEAVRSEERRVGKACTSPG